MTVPFNRDLVKVLHPLKRKACDYGKAKTKPRLRFSNYKSKHRSCMKGKQNVSRKCFHSHYAQDCNKGTDWKVKAVLHGTSCKIRFVWLLFGLSMIRLI